MTGVPQMVYILQKLKALPYATESDILDSACRSSPLRLGKAPKASQETLNFIAMTAFYQCSETQLGSATLSDDWLSWGRDSGACSFDVRGLQIRRLKVGGTLPKARQG